MWINTRNIECMEYMIDTEEIHVHMMNNVIHNIKLDDVGSKIFDEILDYNFDLKR